MSNTTVTQDVYVTTVEVINGPEVEVVSQSFQTEIDVTSNITNTAIAATGPPGSVPLYLHTQSSPSTEWIVNHNLGIKPVAQVLDVGGSVIVAEIIHTTINQLRVYFSAPQTGQVVVI